MLVLLSFILGTSFIFNFLLTYFNKSYMKLLWILKTFGSFYIPIQIGIPFCLIQETVLSNALPK